MLVYGNGSIHSPIVISDEEDAAYVEQELGGFRARLTDPEPPFQPQISDTPMYDWAQRPSPSSSGVQLFGNNNAMEVPAPVAGQKRKRHQAGPTDVVHESKNQRKKRRRAERLAAEQAKVQEARPAEIPLTSPVSSRTRSKPPPLPDRPVTFRNTQKSGILPPVSWSASIPAPTAVIPPPFFSSLPPKPPPLVASVGPLPNIFQHFPTPPSLPPLPERRPQPPHVLPPLPATIPPAPSLPFPQQLQDPVVSKAEQAPLAQKKILGMPRESDKGRQGIFPIETPRQRLPDPTRTLVLAPIPKKFRNPEFVMHWARKFVRPQPPRIEIDKMSGKALVEFQSVALAERAHGSTRLIGEGKEHIRAWWYRGPAKNPSDLEEGEIEEGVVEELPPQPQLSKKKQSKNQKKADKKKAQAAQLQRQQLTFATSRAAFNAASFGRPLISPTPMTLSQPVPPPISAVLLSDTKAPVASSSRPVVLPAPPRRSPIPYAYRGRADFLERANKYGLVGEESDSDDESDDSYEAMLYGHYRPSKVYQEEEQAMDLESDDEEASPRETPSPGSRYIALAETATAVDSAAAADDASIASSRASSVERDSADRMRVDYAASASAPPPLVVLPNEAATKAPSSLNPSEPPAKPHSPSVFTMVEPRAAPIPVPASDVSAAARVPEPAHSTVDLTRATVSSVSAQPERVPPASSATRAQELPPAVPSLLLAAIPEPTSGPPQRSDSANASTLPAVRADSSISATHTKRTLLEKQRELEERIARAKEELARKSTVSRAASRNTSPEEEPNKVMTSTGSAADNGTHSAVTITAESELRRSALQSRRKTGIPPAESAEGTQSANGVDVPSTPVTAATSSAINFEDLAVSFITETLQTVRPSPPLDPPSATNSLSSHSVPSTAPSTPQPLPATAFFAPVKPNQSTERSLLAARQKRLEQHLAETKMLMTRLGAARTKAEKDNILGTLRERQRAYDDDLKTDGLSKPASHATQGHPTHYKPPVTQMWKTQWPEPSSDAMILIISDDEDDED